MVKTTPKALAMSELTPVVLTVPRCLNKTHIISFAFPNAHRDAKVTTPRPSDETRLYTTGLTMYRCILGRRYKDYITKIDLTTATWSPSMLFKSTPPLFVVHITEPEERVLDIEHIRSVYTFTYLHINYLP